jgi:molybdate transport system substrate-binding protein
MRRFRLAFVQLALLGLAIVTLSAQAPAGQSLSIAAASDLQAVFPEIAGRFERQNGIKARASFGSSGNFFAQIQNGAPFDLFLSANLDYPRQLIASGHADADSLLEYAVGRLVLWTRKDSGIDVSQGLHALTGANVRRIAIANPQHAPYGRAAQSALRQAGIYNDVQHKLVFGENISQTAQLADSGNAQVGLIALSLALGPALQASGKYVEIPGTAHPPLDQAAVIMSHARNKVAAREFVAFLRRPETIQLLQRFGFTPPASPGR